MRMPFLRSEDERPSAVSAHCTRLPRTTNNPSKSDTKPRNNPPHSHRSSPLQKLPKTHPPPTRIDRSHFKDRPATRHRDDTPRAPRTAPSGVQHASNTTLGEGSPQTCADRGPPKAAGRLQTKPMPKAPSAHVKQNHAPPSHADLDRPGAIFPMRNRPDVFQCSVA